jgi:hypothetical protein
MRRSPRAKRVRSKKYDPSSLSSDESVYEK